MRQREQVSDRPRSSVSELALNIDNVCVSIVIRCTEVSEAFSKSDPRRPHILQALRIFPFPARDRSDPIIKGPSVPISPHPQHVRHANVGSKIAFCEYQLEMHAVLRYAELRFLCGILCPAITLL